MLDAFIIEEIRRREAEQERVRPQLERPSERGQRERERDDRAPVIDGTGRGAIIIDRDADDDDNGCIVIDM